jgi:hypothetical protein
MLDEARILRKNEMLKVSAKDKMATVEMWRHGTTISVDITVQTRTK